MRISKALVLFTHLIALFGFLALSITGAVSPLAVALFSVSLVLSFYSENYGKEYYLGSRLSSLLAILLIIYVGSSILLLGREIITGLLEFLIYTQILKLLGRKTQRDILQIYLLSFFQFLAGTVLTQSFLYGVVFLLYIAVSIWALMVYTMNKDASEHSVSEGTAGSEGGGSLPRKDPKVVTTLFLSTTFILSICVFIIAALIFISVPRLKPAFFMGSFLNQRELRSGFSEEVTLGRVGEIKLDGSPVMRVKILNKDEVQIPEPIYWRGIALDSFDGETWKTSGYDYELLTPDRDGVFRSGDSERTLLHQEVVTEHLDSNVLFSAERPVAFKAKGRKRLERINDSYMLLGGNPGRMKYYAYSDTYSPSREELLGRGENYPDLINASLLDTKGSSVRVKELAEELTSQYENNYDKAVSIKLYLLQNYQYTRTLEGSSLDNPVEDFLFEQKSGHCEYFAAAMVILLREAGVPARIVNGFVGGEWNPHGDFYLVRESDAHSWAEAYFPSFGWVVFDPTPESESAFHEAGTFFLVSYIDYLKFRWQRYVIDFNQRDQIRLLREARSSVRWQGNKLSSIPKLRPGLDKGTLMAGALLLLGLWLFIKKPKLAFTGKKGDVLVAKASLEYSRALKLLSKKGFEKPPSMTPGEFSSEVLRKGGSSYAKFKEITTLYLKLRFGGSNSKKELTQLKNLVSELKKIK